MPYGIIYCATNKKNGKRYVGKTRRGLELRKYYHCSNRNIGGTLFCMALKKYGINEFRWRVLRMCFSAKALDRAENFYVVSLNTVHPSGYNMNVPGKRKKIVTPRGFEKSSFGKTLSTKFKNIDALRKALAYKNCSSVSRKLNGIQNWSVKDARKLVALFPGKLTLAMIRPDIYGEI